MAAIRVLTRVVAMVVALSASVAAAEDVVVVDASGEGISQEAARDAALRDALEKGGKQEIASYSQVENFELIRDTVFSRAEGIVTDYKIVDEGRGMGGVFYCKIQAKVSKSAIASTWGEVQNVLEQLGRPGVMVRIVEKIDGVTDDSSILESKIEERLIKSGFDVYAGEQVKAILAKESADAAAEDDIAKMQAIAKDFGTQIFITGNANANQAGLTEAAGTTLAMYNCDAMAKMYYTDTGKLIASESLPQTRGGARGYYSFSPQAAKMAMANAGEALVDKIYRTCMEQWATRISAGDMIELEIEGLKVADAIKIKKKLAEIEGVSSVNYQMTKGIAKYRIKATMTAETLVEHLVEPEWEKVFEIVDVKMNRIQAKGVSE